MSALMVVRKALLVVLCFSAFKPLAAEDYHGVVTFGGMAIPGVTVTILEGAKTFSTVTDQAGVYDFADLPDGSAKIEITMQGFATLKADITIAPNAEPASWLLDLLPVDKMLALSTLAPKQNPLLKSEALTKKPDANLNPAPTPLPDTNQQTSDGFLVNGTVNNAATSKFSLNQAFGNRRPNSKNLYTGGFVAVIDNSALDARPFSLSGMAVPKPAYDRVTLGLTLGGPIRIPHVLPRGPNFTLGYQWTRDRTDEAESGLVPTHAERMGDLSGLLNSLGKPVTIFDPVTGLPFPGNVVPISPQANALLTLYPTPNISGNRFYNYQVPVQDSNHKDDLSLRVDKSIARKDQISGRFGLSSTRASSANLFSFNDTTDTLGINGSVNWSHRFSQHFFVNTGYQVSRLRTNVTPFFENRENVSGAAGIIGNDQDAANWGPPALAFSSGIAGLNDGQSSFNRSLTNGVSLSAAIYRGHQNITIGGEFRKRNLNDFFQQNPRGTFTFTGAATEETANGTTTGSDLADFLIGIPDTSALAFGNADKYFREPVYDAYALDDWRLRSDLTLNVGVRWEYGAPIAELKDRLVNLDVAPGFTAVAPVLGSERVGTLTGTHYPASLIRPDRVGIEPRIGVSWRPIPASTVVVRAGYGVYRDSTVYDTIALDMAQQAPLSKSLSVENSVACPLTLASGFNPCASTTADTFGVDPNFHVGYAQTWQLSVQRDLPFALQFTGTYLGVKGTHGVQQFLPNTYPIGDANPCPDCPLGFVYETSGGDSTRESGIVQLRRRLRSGFTASLLYTFSKSIDDDAFVGGQGHVATSISSGGTGESSGQGSSSASTIASSPTTPTIAQNWLNLHGERSLSSFDQRNLLNVQIQYTSGEGLGGGTLMGGWRGRLLKEWTVVISLTAGNGLPETPIYLAAVPGTGFTGTIRPDRTGAPLYVAEGDQHLSAAAYTAPTLGQWGAAGRNSVSGPGTFVLNSAVARTFRPNTKIYLDARIDATNAFNHVVFTGWDTTVNSTQFGVPLAANQMRSLETTLRLRF